MNKIMQINAHLKYTEFLLHVFDEYPNETTLKSIRDDFKNKFHTNPILLNQNFGIYRLLPLLLIKEEYKKDRKELKGVVKQIKTIRDSIAHNNFSIDELGYKFNDGKNEISFSYDEFVKFVHKIENEFYDEKVVNK